MSFISKINAHNKPVIMGVLNVTPDSFSDGGQSLTVDAAVKKAIQMKNDGAAIIDIGGESTRPGATLISVDEECQRVMPVIEAIKKTVDIAVSIDTSKAKVMFEAIQLGVDLINDVCALQEKNSINVVANSHVDVCLMHKKGLPQTMQNAPHYGNIIDEINAFFIGRIKACKEQGVDENRLILDPGFGFGKTVEHNFEILKQLKRFTALGLPLLSGTSRKSMIGNVCNAAVNQRLGGSLTTAILAIQNQAKILRVHDVYETNQAIQILTKVQVD